MNIDPTAPDDKPETGQMIVIHKAICREVDLLPRLVDRARKFDPERARSIAAHGFLVLDFLHDHHQTEDRLIWPLLRERAPLDGDLVDAMEHEHAVVDRQLQDSRTALAAWAEHPTPSTVTSAMWCLRALQKALTAHLEHEEDEVLPLVHEHLTVQEWEAAQQAAIEQGPAAVRDRMMLAGIVLEGASPAEHRWFLSSMPAPARAAWRLIGARYYDRRSALIRGDLVTVDTGAAW